MRWMFFWTWGTHCLRTANSSGMVVLGSLRTSLHCGSLGSKKENSASGEKKTETKVYCNANQIDRWNPSETPTYACRESTKRSTLNFRDRLRDRFFQITNLGKCLCCASRAEWNQMRRWKEYYEPNEAWREPDCCWKQITLAFSPALPTFWIHCWTVCIGLTGSAASKRTLTRFI